MGLGRRFGLHVRPLPFLFGLSAVVVGVLRGLTWQWDWARQTGNFVLTLTIPTRIFAFDVERTLFLTLAAVGLVCLLISFSTRARVEERVRTGKLRLLGARARFYPFMFLLGLFLTYFGIAFLFHMTTAADVGANGVLSVFYLDYAGITNRGFVSFIGASLAALGLVCLLRGAISFGHGIPLVPEERRAKPPPAEGDEAPASMPRPAPTPRPAPARPVARRPAVSTTRPAPARTPTRQPKAS